MLTMCLHRLQVYEGSTEYQSWLRQTMQERGPVKIGKRATCLEEVTNMLMELGETPSHTVRNVDIAILDKKIAINFLFDESYIINNSKALLGKTALRLRHYECLGWSSIGIQESTFNRIATLDKKRKFLNDELRLEDYRLSDDENARSPKTLKSSKKKKK